jgi:hypothetical protein
VAQDLWNTLSATADFSGWYQWLYHPKKSVVAEHSINMDHWMQLQNTVILASKVRQMEWILREAVEIELNPDNIEGGFSKSGVEASHLLLERMETVSHQGINLVPWALKRAEFICSTLPHTPLF